MFAVEWLEGGYVRPEVAGRYGPVSKTKIPYKCLRLLVCIPDLELPRTPDGGLW